MPIITNRDAAATALRHGLDVAVGAAREIAAATAARAAELLGDRGHFATNPAVTARFEELHAELASRTGSMRGAERDVVALRGELRDTRAEHTRELHQLRAQHTAAVQAWTDRAQASADQVADVWQVLLHHGRTDLLRDGDLAVADAVRTALSDAPPVGADITDRIAEVLWQAGQTSPPAQHAFLTPPVCRDLAYALAPLVADWTRRAATPTTVAEATP